MQQQYAVAEPWPESSAGPPSTPSADIAPSPKPAATAWERFEGATLSLARSGPIKDRLVDAYRNHLADVSEDDLPRELREAFRAVSLTLTREQPMRGEDAVRATTRKMSTDEADHIACAVVRLFSALPRSFSGSRYPSGQVVPLYLAEA